MPSGRRALAIDSLDRLNLEVLRGSSFGEGLSASPRILVGVMDLVEGAARFGQSEVSPDFVSDLLERLDGFGSDRRHAEDHRTERTVDHFRRRSLRKRKALRPAAGREDDHA